MIMRVFMLAVLLSALTTSAVAESGRYEAVVMPLAGRAGPNANLNARVFILDTEQGHLWTWSDNERVYDDKGQPQFGSVLIYQGRVRPGKRMGEIIERNLHRE